MTGGYVMAFGPCFACKRFFYFNPHWVPSIPDPETGEREPICEGCMTLVNAKRESRGDEPFPIHPEAYRAMEESAL